MSRFAAENPDRPELWGGEAEPETHLAMGPDSDPSPACEASGRLTLSTKTHRVTCEACLDAVRYD